MDPRCAAIWLTVSHIPPGRVATYGRVATLAGLPGQARFVGRVLSRLPEESRVPWHRVVNAQGRLSFPPDSPQWQRQAELLRAEGVAVEGGRVGGFHGLCWPNETM